MPWHADGGAPRAAILVSLEPWLLDEMDEEGVGGSVRGSLESGIKVQGGS